MAELFFLTLILVALAIIGLGLRMLVLKGGKFPEIHVGHNTEMKKKGISCSKNESCLCRGIEPPKPQKDTPAPGAFIRKQRTTFHGDSAGFFPDPSKN